jgi:hypothetical protein
MIRFTDVYFLLFFGTACCTAASAADLPRQGSFTDTFYGWGTIKGSAVGKSRYTGAFEEDGLFVGEGLRNHMTVHCIGISERLNERRRANGRCTLNDVDGDQIAVDAAIDWYPKDAKDFSGDATFVAGTGKYEGITGGFKEICHNGVFRPAADNTFVGFCTNEGSYKLP